MFKMRCVVRFDEFRANKKAFHLLSGVLLDVFCHQIGGGRSKTKNHNLPTLNSINRILIYIVNTKLYNRKKILNGN